MVKYLPSNSGDAGGTWVWPLAREDPLEGSPPLEEEMATHSSILAWTIL